MQQKVSFKFNNYEEFKNFIINELTDFLPKEYMKSRIMITDTIKTNGIEREIIAFIRPLNVEEKATAIEITELYKIYKNTNFDIMLKKINKMINFVENDNMTKEDVLKNTIMRICKKDKCQFDLDDMPHRDVFDLSIYYCITMDEDDFGSSLCPLNNSIMEDFNITEQELFEVCIKKSNQTVDIKTLEESTKDIISKFPKQIQGFLSDIHNRLTEITNEGTNTIIVSDKKQRNGAVNILNNKVLKQVADYLDSDIYISVVDNNNLSCFSKDEHSIDALKIMMKKEMGILKTKELRMTDSIYLYKREDDNLYLYTK